MAIKLWVNVELLLIEKQVNKLNEKNVNDTDDNYIVLPGPDVKVANNNHEDIEIDTKESEMVKTASNLESCKTVQLGRSNGKAGSHILKGKLDP